MDRLPVLQTAVSELSWLLGRGYAERSALALVGNRHALCARQRKAVSRCAAADEAARARRSRRVDAAALANAVVHVDGFNVIIGGESVWSGGVVLLGRDGAHRDLASVHGTYARVEQTLGVLDALAGVLAPARAVVWYLDRPVSNSGRLAGLVRQCAQEHGCRWDVELVWDPDAVLIGSEAIVATADARILDAGIAWVDLVGALVSRAPGRTRVLDLGTERSAERDAPLGPDQPKTSS
ncbi:MAG: DUF434 domain-containing protein [Myxococcota bacterium]